MAFEAICCGKNPDSPIAQLDNAYRFRWLTATRNTILQTVTVHIQYTEWQAVRNFQRYRLTRWMPWHIPTPPSPKRKARARLRPCVFYSRWLCQHTSGTKAKKRRLYFKVVTSFNMFAHVAFAGTAGANKLDKGETFPLFTHRCLSFGLSSGFVHIPPPDAISVAIISWLAVLLNIPLL